METNKQEERPEMQAYRKALATWMAEDERQRSAVRCAVAPLAKRFADRKSKLQEAEAGYQKALAAALEPDANPAGAVALISLFKTADALKSEVKMIGSVIAAVEREGLARSNERAREYPRQPRGWRTTGDQRDAARMYGPEVAYGASEAPPASHMAIAQGNTEGETE